MYVPHQGFFLAILTWSWEPVKVSCYTKFTCYQSSTLSMTSSNSSASAAALSLGCSITEKLSQNNHPLWKAQVHSVRKWCTTSTRRWNHRRRPSPRPTRQLRKSTTLTMTPVLWRTNRYSTTYCPHRSGTSSPKLLRCFDYCFFFGMNRYLRLIHKFHPPQKYWYEAYVLVHLHTGTFGVEFWRVF